MHEFDGACHGDKTKLRKRYPLSKTNLLGLNGPQILYQALGRVRKCEKQGLRNMKNGAGRNTEFDV